MLFLPSGKSDPFCVVRMGTQEQKSDVIEGTLNPKWNKKVRALVASSSYHFTVLLHAHCIYASTCKHTCT